MLLVVLGSPSVLHAATAAWTRNTEPNIAGYLLSYGTQTGVHTTVINVGNVATYTFNPPPGYGYYVVVQAYFTAGAPGPKSDEAFIDVQGANRAPTLTQPANQTSAENASPSLQLVASDLDGNPLTYSVTGLPPSLVVNTTTGLISGVLTYTSAGTYTVTATASDGSLTHSRTFTWTVTDTNRAPALTQPANQTHAQNASVSLALVASDPDGTALTYSATGLPPGVSLNALTGLISGTVTTAGAFSVTATASDGTLTASGTFTWTVTATTGSTSVNLSPLDTTINVNNTNASTSYRINTYTLPANRVANAALLKFDLSAIPSNATIQSAILNLSLIEMDTATTDPNYSVSLHQIINRNPNISLATGLTADGVTQWTANACCTNNYPMAQADISVAQSVAVVNRTLGVKTWDATSMVQAWRASPATNYGLLLNPDLTKAANRYRFFASMENTTVAQRPFLRVTYTLAATDTTPPAVSLSAPANNATVSGATVAVSATATDAVGVAGVQFRLNGVNLGAEDTATPFAITWNTTTAANGTQVLTAVARDAAGNAATSAPVTVTVSNAVPNRAPTLNQPANQTSAEGAAVSLALVASDPDGNPLTYSATGLPGGLAINAASGLVSGTLTFSSAGPYTVTATASDGLLSNSRTFSWTVTNTNRAPALTQPLNQTSMVNTTVSLTLAASDPDGTAVTYSATGLPAGLGANASTGVISGTLGSNSAGVYTVTANASDGSLTATRTFVWSVNNTDVGVSGDFDGDGRDDVATYRPSTGEWRVWTSGSNFAPGAPVVWGTLADVPLAADYDGDNRTDLAVYRPSTGTWHVRLSSTNGQTTLAVQWGDAADRPVPIDYDGDGRADLALVRYGGYEILLSGSNYTTSVTVR